MIYHRCAPSDYDSWATELGNPNWSYKQLIPYFKKSEQFHESPLRPLTPAERSEHGSTGPWQITYSQYTAPSTSEFIRASVENGIERVSDFNNSVRGTLGVSRFATFTTSDGWRSSTKTAWLTDDVLKRKNLAVGVGCQVLRLEFEGKACVGVLFRCARDGS